MADPEDRPADDERDGSPVGSEDDHDAGGSDEDASDDGPTEDDAPTDDDDATGDGGDSAGEDTTEREGPGRDQDESDEPESDEPDEDDRDEDEGTDDEDEGTDDEGSEPDDADLDDTASEPASALPPPVEPAPFVELMAAYRQPATAGAERLPWSWTTLSPTEKEAAAVVLDGFVESYNQTWAISADQTVPPCWHRHPALAHDLSTLAWSYFHAYRDATATPDRALGFQAHLPLFAERVDRWLGANADDCRGGRHTDPRPDRVPGARGTSVEDADAVLLLGREAFGFPPPHADR